MVRVVTRKRALATSVLFFLCACTPQPCQKWVGETIDTPCHPYERWVYPCSSDFSGLSLEYSVYPEPSGSRFFINLCSTPRYESNPEIEITFADRTMTFQGEMYEGNQRVLLPLSANEPLIEALRNDECFTIKMMRFQDEITSYGFQQKPKNWHTLF